LGIHGWWAEWPLEDALFWGCRGARPRRGCAHPGAAHLDGVLSGSAHCPPGPHAAGARRPRGALY